MSGLESHCIGAAIAGMGTGVSIAGLMVAIRTSEGVGLWWGIFALNALMLVANIAAIRARKIREEEDRVIAHAEAIKDSREKASS